MMVGECCGSWAARPRQSSSSVQIAIAPFSTSQLLPALEHVLPRRPLTAYSAPENQHGATICKRRTSPSEVSLLAPALLIVSELAGITA